MHRKIRILCIVLLILITLSSCRGATEQPLESDNQPAATPVFIAPEPTPEPVNTTLIEAFEFAKEHARDVPQAGDPSAVFPYSSKELLGSRQLKEMTPREMEWAWREIAARAGIKPYKSYDFTDREWYEPDPDFKREKLSQIEAMNIVNIRNTALENYNNIKIVKNNKATADLDGNGKSESFSFSVDKFSNTGTLQIASSKFTIEHPLLDNRLYLCNINREDDKLELAIPFTDPGDDYKLAFYAYDGEALTLIGTIQGDRDTIRINGDGKIIGYSLETQPFHYRYQSAFFYDGEKLRPEPAGIRNIKVKVTTIKDIELIDAKENLFTMPSGTEVAIISLTPKNELFIYDIQTRAIGMIVLGEGSTIAGEPFSVFFDNLPTFA